MTTYVLLIGAAVVAIPSWAFVTAATARLLLAGALALALGSAIVSALLGEGVPAADQAVATLFAAALCVAGGGVVTVAIFDSIDHDTKDPANADPPPSSATTPTAVVADRHSMSSAGQVLRGGAWIGALERIAVFAALLAKSPEGVAVVLAIKGLGRYPELGRDSGSAAGQAVAERFIIGTLASFIWAAGCALAVSSIG